MAVVVRDQFEKYFAEKIWASIPSIYRHEDGLAENPGVLRAIVQTMARQAAILRRSQDDLWEDQFIELCSEWAVPYIGDLVATRMLSALNKRGRRIDVAKTIYYRRRKGTPAILEQLINDISGWEGKMVEQFQKLSRNRHLLDAFPETLAGKFSGTQPGGFADIRHKHAAEFTNGPFEEFFHFADVRQHHGVHGRYGIPKLAFYLYRLKAFEVKASTPFAFGDGIRFAFDPSGRNIPLFSQSVRDSEKYISHSATEPELPAPIPCRLLGDEAYEITSEVIMTLSGPPTNLTAASAAELMKFSGLTFKNISWLLTLIQSLPAAAAAELTGVAMFKALLELSITGDCGKSVLLPGKLEIVNGVPDRKSILVWTQIGNNLKIFNSVEIRASVIAAWSAPTPELLVDSEGGCFRLPGALAAKESVSCNYSYGFPGNIGAGSYDRPWVSAFQPTLTKTNGGSITTSQLNNNKFICIADNKTYGPVGNLNTLTDLNIYSDNYQRPYIMLNADWVLDTGAQEDASLLLDGLWIGGKENMNAKIILRGNYECVIIRNCTLDPGGDTNVLGNAINPVELVIDGFVENLCIESSIIGLVTFSVNGNTESIEICDSIIQSTRAGIPAMNAGIGMATLKRTTVFGDVVLHTLNASESVFTGNITLVDSQNGCFRFSAANKNNVLPHPFESFLFENDTNHWFTSRKFSHPGYAQLTETAPAMLQRGAENGSEMGAFSSLLNPIRFDGLKSKIDEYMPFGLIPIYINKT